MSYKTAQIAKMIGVHPNTIRFYEEMGLLPAIPRNKNGYRIFRDRDVEQLRLLRIAFRAEIVCSRLRQEVILIIKTAAEGNIDKAYLDTLQYQEHLMEEAVRAEEAIRITQNILEHDSSSEEIILYKGRGEAALELGITVDVLRDWERNGLIQIPQDQRGHKQFYAKEMNRLKIIRTLRSANYSMMAILRMLKHLDQGKSNIRDAINSPGEEEDIVGATDRYITALSLAERDAQEMLLILNQLKQINY